MRWVLGSLAWLSLGLLLWQWVAARRFPLHRRGPATGFSPGLTLLKPLRGCDAASEGCLRSWLAQEYPGPVQVVFGVAAAADPVCDIVRKLQAEFPGADAQLVVCAPLEGANLKVAKLAMMERLAKHELLVISDADVSAPPDLLRNIVQPLEAPETGMVNCFYRLANPGSLAMRWEAVAVNADFWSQVLQSQSLKPLDFALGAVMATRRQLVAEIGGFAVLADCLADDYQLGNRIARRGHRIQLSPVVVECWDPPKGWAEVWKHQLRWARTVRVCQPMPYFFSILSNATLWPLVWLAVEPSGLTLGCVLGCGCARLLCARDLQQRLNRAPTPLREGWLAWLKDLLQAVIWLLAFLGNTIEWRGERMTLRRDGTLVRTRET
jgi:ceramide glucosyltransferase